MRRRWVKGVALETVRALRGFQKGDEVLIKVTKEDIALGGPSALKHEPNIKMIGKRMYTVHGSCDGKHHSYWTERRTGPSQCVGFTIEINGTDTHFLQHQLVGWRPARPK